MKRSACEVDTLKIEQDLNTDFSKTINTLYKNTGINRITIFFKLNRRPVYIDTLPMTETISLLQASIYTIIISKK